MGVPIPLQYKYRVTVTTTYTKTLEGNKKDTQQRVNYNMSKDDYSTWHKEHKKAEIIHIIRKDQLDD